MHLGIIDKQFERTSQLNLFQNTPALSSVLIDGIYDMTKAAVRFLTSVGFDPKD